MLGCFGPSSSAAAIGAYEGAHRRTPRRRCLDAIAAVSVDDAGAL